MNEPIHLRYGYTAGIPASAQTAWGCRAIITDNMGVELVADRQSGIGPRIDTLIHYLNTAVAGAWLDHANALLRDKTISIRQQCEVTLYEDPVIVIKGNTNASHGYLHVCAYLRDEQTGHDHD